MTVQRHYGGDPFGPLGQVTYPVGMTQEDALAKGMARVIRNGVVVVLPTNGPIVERLARDAASVEA